jgi:hypothetical protein
MENEKLHKYSISLDGGEGGDTTIKARSDETAIERAIKWAKKGNWPDRTITVEIKIDREDGVNHTVNLQIDPPVPRCSNGRRNHKWVNIDERSVSGRYAGFVITDRCEKCRILRVRDTTDDYDTIEYIDEEDESVPGDWEVTDVEG